MRKTISFLVSALVALPLAASAQQPKQPKEKDADLPTVVAKVNNKEITGTALQEATKLAAAQLQMMGQQMPAGGMTSLRRGVLDDLISMELLAQEARKKKIAPTDKQVDEELKGFKERFPSEEMFHQALAQQGITVKDLRDDVRSQLQIGLLLKQEVEANIKISDDEIKKFYNSRKDQFREPEKAKASHILIKVDSGASDEDRAAAKKKAQDLAKQAKKGADFAKLATEHSDDPGSAKKGGDLGEFSRSDMVKPFADATFALKAGEVSDVVETRFGYHVIKLESKSPAQTLPLKEVRSDIEQYLKLAKSQEEARSYIEKLRAQAKVQTFL